MTDADATTSKAGLVLVTGGSGYFGSLLVDMLLARGTPVRNFDLVDMDDRPAQVDFVQGDIRDLDRIREACRGADVVYHCVAQVPLARDKSLFQSVNVQGAENLLQAAHEAGVRKVVLVSSRSVFGIPKQVPVVETTQPAPVEAYGRAKYEAEQVAKAFHERTGLDLTIIRPTTIVGHGRLGVFQMLFDWIQHGKNVYVLGRGDNLHQFVHAEDLARACMLAAGRPGFAIYNIGGADHCTMRQMLEGLVAHAGTGSRVRGLPTRLAVTLMASLSRWHLAPFPPYICLLYGQDFVFDSSKAVAELGYKPQWGNVAMFIHSYEWYLKNREKVLATRGASKHRSPVKQGLLAVLRWFS